MSFGAEANERAQNLTQQKWAQSLFSSAPPDFSFGFRLSAKRTSSEQRRQLCHKFVHKARKSGARCTCCLRGACERCERSSESCERAPKSIKVRRRRRRRRREQRRIHISMRRRKSDVVCRCCCERVAFKLAHTKASRELAGGLVEKCAKMQ